MENAGRHIPNRLRKQRLMHGYSQKVLASKLGMKKTARICLWEKGKSVPNLHYLLRLCIIYNTLIEELYFDYMKELRELHKKEKEEVNSKSKN